MFKSLLEKILSGENLSIQEAEMIMHGFLKGEFTPAQMGGLLIALRLKGETADEIYAFAKAMREHVKGVYFDAYTVDTCGTGGDDSKSFNISTASAFVCAGAGIRIAKHGNRSVSSRCGSADVLEALGVKIDLQPRDVEASLKEVGMAFLFAPIFHPAMGHVQGARKELGVKTVFNILGPLANPVGAAGQVIGVFSGDIVTKVAAALQKLGTERAFVVHGEGGMDEVTLSGKTKVAYVHDGKIENFSVTPEDFGMERQPSQLFRGGDAQQNAEIIRSILTGERGPKRDLVVLNAAFALVAGKVADNISEGIRLAQSSIDSGRAAASLGKLVRFSNNYAPYTQVG